jgi:hypothetical protein
MMNPAPGVKTGVLSKLVVPAPTFRHALFQ